jgi:hypothetical protein
MPSYDHLKQLIHDRLDDDEGRLLELFDNEEVLNELIAAESPSDWYRFRKRTFDGAYLVKSEHGYDVYNQDRGQISDLRSFEVLRDAARHFFSQVHGR